MEATTPELCPAGLWSPKSSSEKLLNFVANLKHATLHALEHAA